MSENRFCPNCGQKVDAGEKFCANCGYQLSEDVEKVEENKSLESSNPTEVSQSTGQFSQPNNNNYNRPKKPINKKNYDTCCSTCCPNWSIYCRK